MIMLRIIGLAVLLLEVTALIAWAVNDGFDCCYFQVFLKMLKVVSVTAVFVCLFIATIVMMVDPSAIINLFTN